MLSVLATVALIAATGTQGTVFSEQAFQRIYQVDKTPVPAELVHAGAPIRWYKNLWTDKERQGIVYSPSIDASVDESEPEHEYCRYQHGIYLTEAKSASCKFQAFRWVLGYQNSAQVIYFTLNFEYGVNENPFVLIIPVFEETPDEKDDDWAFQNRVQLLSFSLDLHLFAMLEDWNSHLCSFLWLDRLLDYGIFENLNEFEMNGANVTSYVTRPVLVPQSMISSFIDKMDGPQCGLLFPVSFLHSSLPLPVACIMLGVTVTLTVLAMTGTNGEVFSEVAFQRAYRIDHNKPINAEFVHAKCPLALFKENWEKQVHTQGVIYSPLINATVPDTEPEHEYCRYQHGVYLPKFGHASCKIMALRWALDSQNSEDIVYITLNFQYGVQGNPFVLIVPFFEEPTGDHGTEWASENQVALQNFNFEKLTYRMLENWGMVVFRGDWLAQLFAYGIFRNNDLFVFNGAKTDSFVTRPILLSRWKMNKFVQKIKKPST